MRILKYSIKRLAFLPPQLIGISAVTFLLVRLLPGDPALMIAGSYATEPTIAAVRDRLGLDQPIVVQYIYYLRSLIRGDWGRSWYTSNPVLVDIQQRLPATLELVTLALFLSIIIGIPLGVLISVKRGFLADRGFTLYGLLSGSFPDFWLGLVLIYVFFVTLGVVPAPLGRLDPGITSPARVSGFYLIDATLAQDWTALSSAVRHVLLPVLTLTVVYMAPIIKMTRSMMINALSSSYITYATACGISRRTLIAYGLRSALPPVLMVIGTVYGYLLGGAVLVETVFAWGGMGQYAVQAIANSDFSPIQAFVVIGAVFTLIVYLLVDLAFFVLDPRLEP